MTHPVPGDDRARARGTTRSHLGLPQVDPFSCPNLPIRHHDLLLDAGGGLPGEDIFEQAAYVTAAPPARRDQIAAALSSLSPVAAARTMRPEDIARLAAEHDIAFHTLHHHRLDTLTAPQLKAAVRDVREELERLEARPLTLLAYPHGAAGPREATAAREAGFSLGFTTIWERAGARATRS